MTNSMNMQKCIHFLPGNTSNGRFFENSNTEISYIHSLYICTYIINAHKKTFSSVMKKIENSETIKCHPRLSAAVKIDLIM